MTEKELDRLEEIACSAKYFYDYAPSYGMKYYLEEILEKAKFIAANKNEELLDEYRNFAAEFLYNHFRLDYILKEAITEFHYWTLRNGAIANVICEYLGILGGIYKNLDFVKSTYFPISEDLTVLQNNIESLINMLYAPELEQECNRLGDMLYGIYYSELLLQEDENYNSTEDGLTQHGISEEHKEHTDNKSECEKVPCLRERELKTLDALNHAYPELLTYDKLQSNTKLARGTICAALRVLRNYGFAAKNESGNHHITKSGLEYLEKHF